MVKSNDVVVTQLGITSNVKIGTQKTQPIFESVNRLSNLKIGCSKQNEIKLKVCITNFEFTIRKKHLNAKTHVSYLRLDPCFNAEKSFEIILNFL